VEKEIIIIIIIFLFLFDALSWAMNFQESFLRHLCVGFVSLQHNKTDLFHLQMVTFCSSVCPVMWQYVSTGYAWQAY